ncbi:MAG: V-type ATP synthase subunit E [Oscillospiraceae bacterium]|nr:V-type ATP synthase subunit E [Oscillospiraceae bacterium]
MDNAQEKLDRFIAAVAQDAQNKADEIVAAARSESDEILSLAEESARDEFERDLADNKKADMGRCAREISRAQLEAKKRVLTRRRELSQAVFDKVRQLIDAYTASPEYEKKLADSLGAEKDTAGCVLMLAPRDMYLADALKAAAPGISEVRSDSGTVLGGYSLLDESTGIIRDNTFDSRLLEEEQRFVSGTALYTDTDV